MLSSTRQTHSHRLHRHKQQDSEKITRWAHGLAWPPIHAFSRWAGRLLMHHGCVQHHWGCPPSRAFLHTRYPNTQAALGASLSVPDLTTTSLTPHEMMRQQPHSVMAESSLALLAEGDYEGQHISQSVLLMAPSIILPSLIAQGTATLIHQPAAWHTARPTVFYGLVCIAQEFQQ